MTHNHDKPIFHGGNLDAASKQFGIPIDQWLDLSTGISPFAYPIPAIPDKYWRNLPYPSKDILSAAQGYYLGDSNTNRHQLLITAGSQVTIQNLPKILKRLPVLLPSIGYQEHQAAWAKEESIITFYDALSIKNACNEIKQALSENPLQHLVIINPNNPSGLSFTLDQVKKLAQFQSETAMLIIDEAFIDLTPDHSLLSTDLPTNAIVLRSFGKFFGLAGLRVGCVIGNKVLIDTLASLQGPWAVPGPSLFVASQAWLDEQWTMSQQGRIIDAYESTLKLMAPLFSNEAKLLTPHANLFLSYLCPHKEASSIYDFFANKGILLRYVLLSSEHAIIRSSLVDHFDSNATDRILTAITAFLS